MKSLFASKTFWTNVIGLAALAAPMVYPPAAILASPEVQATLVGALMGIANVGLRLVTKEPVTL